MECLSDKNWTSQQAHIERRLHHIWVGEKHPSPLLLACRNSVINLHKIWAVHYWDETALLSELREYVKNFKQAFKFSGNHIFVDTIRYLLLHKYGGWYIDHDVWGVRSFDALCANRIVFGKHKFANMQRYLITNAIVGACRSDPILIEGAVYTMQQFSHSRHYNMGGLAHVARKYKIPPLSYKYFYPHYYKEPSEKYTIFPETYAIHLWHRHLPYDIEKLFKSTANVCP